MANPAALAGPDSRWKELRAKPAGFWAGFWHGLILPISFTVSLFTPKVRIYETNNRGRLYDFGFLLGASAELSAGGTQLTGGTQLR